MRIARTKTKKEWFNNLHHRLAQKFHCHPETIRYLRGKILGSDFTLDELLEHTQKRFLHYPHNKHWTKWFYYCAYQICQDLKDGGRGSRDRIAMLIFEPEEKMWEEKDDTWIPRKKDYRILQP